MVLVSDKLHMDKKCDSFDCIVYDICIIYILYIYRGYICFSNDFFLIGIICDLYTIVLLFSILPYSDCNLNDCFVI